MRTTNTPAPRQRSRTQHFLREVYKQRQLYLIMLIPLAF